MNYAYSLLAVRSGEVRHSVGVVAADSKDAAIGMAYRIGHKLYSLADGWGNHHVVVTSTDSVITAVENAVLLEDK